MSGSEVVAVQEEQERSGSRNLALLAIGAVVIALTTTVVGVYMYVSSGDIYLDRSLPGLLPEASEQDEGRDEQYVFSDSGAIDKGVVDEYLKYFGEIEKEIEAFSEPFSDKPLADDNLIFISDEAK